MEMRQLPIAITAECAKMHGNPKLTATIHPVVKYDQYANWLASSFFPRMTIGNGANA
eukprot:CAMPEP_0196728674 /NCGR_PEP_ID=MMETSP1091-20130531/9284_1 /TAXON_ID=302021 /ORGANISM="Rhodomonas sp., Strain CCMP768" /LENGTH=56 /DNA_ID=CAMNT_0042071457 /DNA_START=191 /DNA_END=361 /DNA_ORIENTATION=-